MCITLLSSNRVCEVSLKTRSNNIVHSGPCVFVVVRLCCGSVQMLANSIDDTNINASNLVIQPDRGNAKSLNIISLLGYISAFIL